MGKEGRFVFVGMDGATQAGRINGNKDTEPAGKYHRRFARMAESATSPCKVRHRFLAQRAWHILVIHSPSVVHGNISQCSAGPRLI